MDHSSDQPAPARRPPLRRLAGAPISWGACEVPGWGPMPDVETVLDEMSQLGLSGTERGPPGFLPADPVMLRAQLQRHGLQFVGAFTPLVLHEPDLEPTARRARAVVDLLARAGGQVLVVAVVQEADWGTPRELSDSEWRRVGAHASQIEALAAEHGITTALHPHAGTLIETADQVTRALSETEVGWCLDTGHLLIGGTDPAAFARDHGHRVTHVHLKDVDEAVAARLRAGELSLLQATREGLYLPLGDGDVAVAATIKALDAHGYDGWFVLEQDMAIAADEPPADRSAVLDATKSIGFLNSAQRTEEEINR